jgi:hypothetical protein
MGAMNLKSELAPYFHRRYGTAVRIESVALLGMSEAGVAGEKGFGYGVPFRVRLGGAPVRDVVLHTFRRDGFGHETLADHAATAVLAYETFNNLPHHVRALDVGVRDSGGAWLPLGDVRDFFLVTEYAEGEPYFRDLERLASTNLLTEADLRRVDLLASYLARIHGDRREAPTLYLRRTRELFGHHECILGLLDSYDAVPLEGFTTAAQLREIERRCVDWRHRLKVFTHRLCRVHGDFHPWNVLWRPDDQFTLLDRSRGEWGEAADDVSCMAINYLFFALEAHGRLTGVLRELWRCFFERYLAATGDEELLYVIPPFFVWRALVIASPRWYPALDVGVRRALFRFIDGLLGLERFDWQTIDSLL